MDQCIKITDISKSFKSKAPAQGSLWHRFQRYFRPVYRDIDAVRLLNFKVERGERVAFLGPNGAGKSTTIKMMAGILHPSKGDIQVLGMTPWLQRQELSFRIGTVFGQRSQLWYHLPAMDTFALLAKIYRLDTQSYRQRLGNLVERFELGNLLTRPVKQLSLGERMRCEIVGSLLHKPDILFLDEPTIGLDVTAKATIRDLIKEMSQKDGATVFLTSHDTGDVENVCDRVLVINHGELLLDEAMSQVKRRFVTEKIVKVAVDNGLGNISGIEGRLLRREPHQLTYALNTRETSVEKFLGQMIQAVTIKDLSVEDPPMEEIVRRIYESVERRPAP